MKTFIRLKFHCWIWKIIENLCEKQAVGGCGYLKSAAAAVEQSESLRLRLSVMRWKIFKISSSFSSSCRRTPAPSTLDWIGEIERDFIFILLHLSRRRPLHASQRNEITFEILLLLSSISIYSHSTVIRKEKFGATAATCWGPETFYRDFHSTSRVIEQALNSNLQLIPLCSGLVKRDEQKSSFIYFSTTSIDEHSSAIEIPPAGIWECCRLSLRSSDLSIQHLSKRRRIKMTVQANENQRSTDR